MWWLLAVTAHYWWLLLITAHYCLFQLLVFPFIKVTKRMGKTYQKAFWCQLNRKIKFTIIFFSMWVFFHNHSRITGLQGKGEGISLTPHYHFHPLHRHLDIGWVIMADSSPLPIGISRTRTGNLWFLSASC